MNEIDFLPAKREAVGLLVGVAGPTGSGKTYSALRLAAGMAGGKRFAVIDTEARRALHYADAFQFDHADFPPPFSPARYADIIKRADAKHYPVIVVDSFSHEHAGEGGILDMQEAELERMTKGEYQRRDAYKMASWIRPKSEHKRMVQQLLQLRSHLILCFRAEEKIEMVRDGGKLEVRKKTSSTGLDGWIPIAEKTLPYELTASFLLLPTAPGVPLAIKLQEQHRAFFPKGEPITEASGASLAKWALGGDAPRAAPAAATTGAQQGLPVGDDAPNPWRGNIVGTDEEKQGTRGQTTVYVIRGEKGFEARTTERGMRVVADELCGQEALVEWSRTSKGLKAMSVKSAR